MLIDAHNHLQDPRLRAQREAWLPQLVQLPLRCAVVNGTQESDWPAVAALAGELPWVIPSFGLHPWHVQNRSSHWQQNLIAHLDAQPRAALGEVGLDRWIQPHDLALQTEIFTWQLELAAARNLPLTIHCLQAWGPLWEIIRQHPLPARGFLLHAYNGPLEMVDGFCARGAYFSFSPYFLHPRKTRQRAVFAKIPLERLLVETDAPDMAPPPQPDALPLLDAHGAPINHPANIALAYHGLAQIRDLPLAQLTAQVAANFARLFGAPV